MGTINLIVQPTGGAPIDTDDYNYQNVDIEILLNTLVNKSLLLTEWDTSTVPALARYVYINHGGAFFQVKTSNYVITDPGVADGRVYIKVERSGDVLEAEFTDDATGYEWNYVYNGFYHADGSQLLPYVLYLDATNWWKYDLCGSLNKWNIEADIIKVVTVPTGAWDMTGVAGCTIDMDAYFSRNVFTNVLGVDIWNDTANIKYPLVFQDSSGVGGIPNGIYTWQAGDVKLYALGGGYFDSANFDDPTMNRGDVTVSITI